MKKFLNKIESRLDGGSSGGLSGSSAPSTTPQLGSQPSQRHLYYHRKQYGVNLGSWFSLEGWLTGSLWEGSKAKDSEMDLLTSVKPDQARQTLERHWDGFVNDGDWKWMASQGINTVRLPISYYHFCPGSGHKNLMDGTEYDKYAEVYQGAWSRIERAIQTAAQHNIGVLVDLHSAPGAQNTDGHSGLSNSKAGLWDGMSASKNQKKTIAILEALAVAVAKYDNVVGLEVLNEPKNSGSLQGFYEDAVKAIRKQGGDAAGLPLYLGDSWDLSHYSGWVAKQANAGNFLVVDHHLYRCFTKEDHSKSAGDHAGRVSPNGPDHKMLAGASSSLGGSLVIGEWSSALNPGSLQGQSQDDAQRAWGHAQITAYNDLVGGSFYWTLKKEGPPDGGWCLYSAIEKGIIPQHLGRPSQAPGNMTDRGKESASRAFESHSNYWNSHGAKGDHKSFTEGYQRGWNDAEYFWSQGQSQIGFVGQWAKTRAANEGDWEFEHGCSQAIGAFNQALRG